MIDEINITVTKKGNGVSVNTRVRLPRYLLDSAKKQDRSIVREIAQDIAKIACDALAVEILAQLTGMGRDPSSSDEEDGVESPLFDRIPDGGEDDDEA